MRLAAFGATGPTGRLLIRQALDAGHSVVAYARNPAKLDVVDSKLSVVAGELSDAAAIGAAVRGADAVLSVLGLSPTKGVGTPIAGGTDRILAAMREYGARRMVAGTTFSVTAPADQPPLSATSRPTARCGAC
jgi:putative NADH-flavin reductase